MTVGRDARAGTPTVVLFDLDDTLLRHSDSLAAGLLAYRRQLGGEVAEADDDAELARWLALEETHYSRYLTGELDFLGQRRERVRGFIEPFGESAIRRPADGQPNEQPDERPHEWLDRWFAGYAEHYRAAWSLYDDAVAALDSLERALPRVRFGVITNSVGSYQRDKIRHVGLEDRFEHVVASGEVGVAKPDPRIFELACGLFGIEPADAVYVGDRLETDAVGASRAGLAGVWLCRTASVGPVERRAAAASGVAVIGSLGELPALLGENG